MSKGRAIKEIGMQGVEGKVKAYAKKQGWYVRKMASPGRVGVPDNLFISPAGEPCFVEFKAPGKRPTHKQEKELTLLKGYNQLVFVIDGIGSEDEPLDFEYWNKDFETNLSVHHNGIRLLKELMEL